MVLVQRSIPDGFSSVLNGKDPVTGKNQNLARAIIIKCFIAIVSFTIFMIGVKFHGTTSGSQVRSVAVESTNVISEDGMIKFAGFNDDLIPTNTVLDINIGTNLSPMRAQDDRYRILVDPLFAVCDNNAKQTENVTAFCVSTFVAKTSISIYTCILILFDLYLKDGRC